MKNKMLATLLATAACCSVFAFTGCDSGNDTPKNEGLNYELNANKDGYIVSNIGTVTDETVVIPSTYNNLPVVGLGNTAFEGCTSLTSITLPENLISIGSWAFSGCSSLTKVTIPDSVTAIWEFAFENCTSLTSVNIPDGLTLIGNSAFYRCSSLKSITIPAGVLHIGSGAFSNCTAITVYCEAESQPTGWNSAWGYNNISVVWGRKN